MISIKNICLSQTFKASALVVLVSGLILLASCTKNSGPSGLEIKFFPVTDKNSEDIRTQPFGNEIILLRLDAKQQFTSEQYVSSVLQPFLGDPIVYCDKHLFYKGDSLPANTNLFQTTLCKLETIQTTGDNGNTYDNHYILNVNPDLDSNFINQNSGLYEFKVIGFTTDRLTILDSTNVELN